MSGKLLFDTVIAFLSISLEKYFIFLFAVIRRIASLPALHHHDYDLNLEV